MIKRLRDKAKNKKGFTLVELIVVIVIILVLAAVLVPSLLRYVDKANEANCKADAATILSQVQADYALVEAEAVANSTKPANTDYDFEVNGVEVVLRGALETNGASYTVGTTGTDSERIITSFRYNNGSWTATWLQNPTGTETAWTVTKNP